MVDGPHTTYYWSTIVSIALSCTISSYLTLNNYRDLEIWVDPFKLVPFESFDAVSYSPSIVTGSVLHHVRDKAIYWSKIVIFHTPLHSTPRYTRRSIAIPFGMEKLEWSGYPTMKKTSMICLAVSTEYRRVTDRRTDGQTSCHGINRAMHTRCAVIKSTYFCDLIQVCDLIFVI